MCYIAYTIQNWVLNKTKGKFTEKDLRSTMDKMQVSHIQNEEKHFYIRSKQSTEQKQLQKALKIKELPPMMPVNQAII